MEGQRDGIVACEDYPGVSPQRIAVTVYKDHEFGAQGQGDSSH